MSRRTALVDELKRVSEIVGRTPTEEDMLEHGNFAYSTYFRYFQSWTHAKSIAGVDDPTDVKIGDEELLVELRRGEQSVDGSPTRREVDRLAEYPSSTYKHRFVERSARSSRPAGKRAPDRGKVLPVWPCVGNTSARNTAARRVPLSCLRANCDRTDGIAPRTPYRATANVRRR